MFKSSLTSSISGWFSGSSSENKEEASSEATPKEAENGAETQPTEAEATTKSEDGNSDSSESKSALDKLTSDEMQAKISEETQKMMNSAKTFGSYLFGVATEASKKVSEKVTETATTIKKTVEEQSMIGDLNKEQEEFLRQKRERQIGDASVPPWVGYQEGEAMKQQILALSADKRNFLRNPPSGVQFNFDFDHHYPIAMATLKEDSNLEKMRFDLVPKNLKEEVFWRNYFYRVSLIKQSAQLSTLAEMTRSGSDQSSASSASSAVVVGSTNVGTISRSGSSKSLNKSDNENSSSTPNQMKSLDHLNMPELDTGCGPEFVSDDFDPSGLNPDDLEREMKQLGMEDGAGEVPEWEKELQQELQDYEVIPGGDKDNTWEKEIEDMLSDEAQKQ